MKLSTRILTAEELAEPEEGSRPTRTPSGPIIIPSEEDISALLEQGADSYTICSTLNCSRQDVINVDRRRRGLKKLISHVPDVPESVEVLAPEERLLLFPPVPRKD